MFFTNAAIPVVDGIDINKILDRWGVEVVTLPITWRLPAHSVTSWGNQFYVFDVIEFWSSSDNDMPLILLDSDCVWIRSVREMVTAITENGALTYLLDYPTDFSINGISTEDMARFLKRHSGIDRDTTAYYAGEIFAASSEMARTVASRARLLWPAVIAGAVDSPREEAHLLSIIYAMEDLRSATANPFIKRIWTNFRHNNVRPSDIELTVWHLPSEKGTGFLDLYRRIVRFKECDPRQAATLMGLDLQHYCQIFGIPRRSLWKLVRDLSRTIPRKLASKI